jgi:hypothetical protein
MTAIPARARGGEHLAGHRGQFERVVAFAVGGQTGIEGAPGPRNWSISRRSKSSMRTSPRDSPAGFAMAASINNMQDVDYNS